MAQQIQLRGGTAAQWATANPILAAREMGVVTDTQNYKIGDGVTPWNSLPAFQLSPTLGAVTLTAVADPSSPAEGNMAFYSKNIAGRLMPKWKGPSGLDTPVQPAFFGNSIQMLAPGGGVAPSAFGMVAPTTTGTASHPNIVGGNGLRQSMRRWNIISAATASSMAYARSTTFSAIRGDQPGIGGFFAAFRFALPSILANKAVIVGMTANTSLAVGQVPTASINCIQMGADAADANLMLMHNDGVGNCTEIDLGAGFPKNDINAVYELVLFCAPNSAQVHWRASRLDTGAEASGTLTTDLPGGSIGLAPQMWVSNSATATAVQIDLMRVYIESDY